MKVIPAILETNSAKVSEKIKLAKDHGLDMVHLDVMDGKFVPNTCWGEDKVAKLFNISLEIHLMVMDPLIQARKWLRLANVTRVIIHLEALGQAELADIILGKLDKKIGLAVNPDTEIIDVTECLYLVNYALIMGVKPGRSGQKFDPRVVKKINQLAQIKKIGQQIGVDGGVNQETAPIIRAAGADVINAASFLWEGGKLAANLKWLQSL